MARATQETQDRWAAILADLKRPLGPSTLDALKPNQEPPRAQEKPDSTLPK